MNAILAPTRASCPDASIRALGRLLHTADTDLTAVPAVEFAPIWRDMPEAV